MPYTIGQLKDRIFKPVFDVYQIFQDFFEPQFTDLQQIPTDEEFQQALEGMDITPTNGLYNTNARRDNRIRNYYETLRPYILVWWPRVTVTNENNRSIIIQDLYAKIFLTMDGRIPYEYRGFKLIRTTFPEVQFASQYCHSHVPRIHNNSVVWNDPCLGSGPINHTIMDLQNNFDETIWMLFCQELALYVTVESLTGGPYIRMESVGAELESRIFKGYGGGAYKTFDSLVDCSSPPAHMETLRKLLEDFIPYYLEHGHLSISYKDKKFEVGMPYFDYIIDISNSFIEFSNQNVSEETVNWMFDKRIIRKAMAANNKFYESNTMTPNDYSQVEGTYLLDFKGAARHLHIEHCSESNTEEVILLTHSISMYILNNILRIINYRYRNEYTKQFSSSRGQEAAPTYKTVIYI